MAVAGSVSLGREGLMSLLYSIPNGMESYPYRELNTGKNDSNAYETDVNNNKKIECAIIVFFMNYQYLKK